MKVRNGFVSNSSSSSFILKFNTSLEDFKIAFNVEYFSYLEEYKKDFREKIALNKIELEKIKDPKSTWKDSFVYPINKYESYLKRLEEDEECLLDILFEDERIKIVNESYPLILEWYVVIHNSYQDSIPTFLNEMIFHCMAEEGIKVELERTPD